MPEQIETRSRRIQVKAIDIPWSRVSKSVLIGINFNTAYLINSTLIEYMLRNINNKIRNKVIL